MRRVGAELDVRWGVGRSERGRCLLSGPHGAHADVLAVEVSEPVVERALYEDGGELRGEGPLILVVLRLGELRSSDELAQPGEELGLEGADGHVPFVSGRVDPVTREPAREHPGHGLAPEPV